MNKAREAKHNSREIAKLYFLLMLFISTAYHKIKKDDTGEEVLVLKREINLIDKDISYDGLSHGKLLKLKKALSDSKLIECILSRETTDIYNNKVWLSKPTLYRLTYQSFNYNSSSIVNLKYSNVNKKLINILSNINLPYIIDQNSLQFIELHQDRAASRLNKPKKQWSLDLLLSFYNRLWVTDIVGNFCNDRTTKMHETEKGLRPDNRIYTGFHILDKDIRPRVYMDNEPLVECFDVHNCHATLINAILPKTIPTSEKELYLSKTISGTFYEDVMEFVNNMFKTECDRKKYTVIADEYLSQKFDKPWSRDDTKTAVNKYLNLSKKKLKRARRTYELRRPWKSVNEDAVYVDEYFKTFFPSIREFIITTPKTNKTYEKIPGKKRSQKTIYEIIDDIVKQKPIKKCIKLSDMVTLNDMLNTVETDIITNHICKDLYENYNITAISLHDGIFVKKSDCSRMPDVVKEFNDLITYYDILK